jgi:hypothetical protein
MVVWLGVSLYCSASVFVCARQTYPHLCAMLYPEQHSLTCKREYTITCIMDVLRLSHNIHQIVIHSGLIESADTLHTPLTMGFGSDDRSKWYWNYAANKDDGTNKTCPTADTDCYFLPHHNCGSHEEIYSNSTGIERVQATSLPVSDCDVRFVRVGYEKAMNAYLFMTRKQLWLRRAIYNFKKEFRNSMEPEDDCSVLHVRRGDTVLDQNARKYFPIKNYLEKLPKEKLNVSTDTMNCTLFHYMRYQTKLLYNHFSLSL